MKEINFLPDFIPDIVSGKKTETRRPLKLNEKPRHIILDSVNTDEMIFNFFNRKTYHFQQMRSRYLPGDNVLIGKSEVKLKFLDINVQRIGDMTDEDVIAEGIDKIPHPYENSLLSYEDSFRNVWVSIYGMCGYSIHDWIWVYKFETFN